MNGVDTFNGIYTNPSGTDFKIYDGIKNTTDSTLLPWMALNYPTPFNYSLSSTGSEEVLSSNYAFN